MHNLIGIKYNMLTVIKKLPSVDYGSNVRHSFKRMWLCKCDCGNMTEANTGALTCNKKKSCGCLTPTKSAENSRKSRYKLANKNAGYNSIYASYKANAIKRNIEFNVDSIDFIKLLKSNCFYCGIKPSNTFNKRYYNIKYNGVDRRDNDSGYTITNSVSCCKMCNISKNNNTEEQFLLWIKRVNKYQTKLNKK